MQKLLQNRVIRLIIPAMLSVAIICWLFPMNAKADGVAGDRIVSAAYSYQYSPAPSGYCASWVSSVYKAAGYSISGNACDMWAVVASTGSSDINDLQPGMIIATPSCSYTPGSAGWCYGHVGIYIGDGMVMHSTQGWVFVESVYSWMENYANHCDDRPIMWGYSWDALGDAYSSYDMFDDTYYYEEEENYEESYDYSGYYGNGGYTNVGLSSDGYIYDDSYEMGIGVRYCSLDVFDTWVNYGAMYDSYGSAYILDEMGDSRVLVICSAAYGQPGDYVDFYFSDGGCESAVIYGNLEDYYGVLSAADDPSFSSYNIVYLTVPEYGNSYEVYNYINGTAISDFVTY